MTPLGIGMALLESAPTRPSVQICALGINAHPSNAARQIPSAQVLLHSPAHPIVCSPFRLLNSIRPRALVQFSLLNTAQQCPPDQKLHMPMHTHASNTHPRPPSLYTKLRLFHLRVLVFLPIRASRSVVGHCLKLHEMYVRPRRVAYVLAGANRHVCNPHHEALRAAEKAFRGTQLFPIPPRLFFAAASVLW